MKKLLILLFCCVRCVNNADDTYYGSVDLDLLTELTWIDVEYDDVAGKFFPAGEEKPELWNLKWYSCEKMSCDTLCRYDTSSANEGIRIESDTIEFLNVAWRPKNAKITKLNKNELVMKYIDADSDIYRVFTRNHKVLVTKGIGDNEGNNVVDYEE